MRSLERARPISGSGVELVEGDLLTVTPERLAALLRDCDVAAHLATALRPGSPGLGTTNTNAALRVEGTRRLLDAVLAAGVPRYVQQSIVMTYPDGGDAWLDESTPFDASTERSVTSAPVVEMEAMVRATDPAQVSWTILRGGSFVGSETSQDGVIERLRDCSQRVPGDGRQFSTEAGPPGAPSAVGFWQVPNFYAASGSIAVESAPGGSCPERRLTWRAATTNGTLPRGIGNGVPVTKAIGGVYGIGLTEPEGTVQASTNEFGTGIESFSFYFQRGECTYRHVIPRQIYYDAGPSLQYVDGTNLAVSIAATADSLSGGIVARAVDSCPAVALYFVATRPRISDPNPAAVSATAPPPPPAPPPRGVFMTEPVFDETFQASVIFTGGTVDELEGIGLVNNLAGVWVADESGTRWLLEVRGGYPHTRRSSRTSRTAFDR